MRLPRVYEARVKLLLTPGQPGSGIGQTDILAAQRLITTYSELIKTRPVLEAAISEAGLSFTYAEASKAVQVTPVRDTQLLEAVVRANDPGQAADFANAVARTFISQLQVSQSLRFAASKESLLRQVEQLATDVAQQSQQLDALRAELPGP